MSMNVQEREREIAEALGQGSVYTYKSVLSMLNLNYHNFAINIEYTGMFFLSLGPHSVILGQPFLTGDEI